MCALGRDLVIQDIAFRSAIEPVRWCAVPCHVHGCQHGKVGHFHYLNRAVRNGLDLTDDGSGFRKQFQEDNLEEKTIIPVLGRSRKAYWCGDGDCVGEGGSDVARLKPSTYAVSR